MQPADEQLSEESRKCLIEVKKGKTRRFVIFKDGVQIERMIIFKAGTFERVIRMARQDGVRGDEYWGILDGDGTDIRFELSRSEGFTTPPGTDIRLKEFLRETTGWKFEPTYVIVDKSPPIDEHPSDDESDDASDSESASESKAGASSIATEESNEEKFVRLLKSILPHVKQALSTNTSVSDDLRAAVRDAQDLGRQRRFEPGLDALRRVGELTKQALSAAGSATSTSVVEDNRGRTASAQQTRRQQWEARLADIQPRYVAALSDNGANVVKLQKVMGYTLNEARQQRFTKAIVGLDRLKQLLDAAT